MTPQEFDILLSAFRALEKELLQVNMILQDMNVEELDPWEARLDVCSSDILKIGKELASIRYEVMEKYRGNTK